MRTVRILIADDHEVVRRGLRALLESQPGWSVCAESTTGREAVYQTASEKPDIVIMDVNMPELNGLDATTEILKFAPRTQVLILTAHDSEQLVRQMLRSGARGYVLKSDAGQDLVAAVEALLRRRLFFTPSVSDLVLSDYASSALPNISTDEVGRLNSTAFSSRTLSSRERQVVQLLAEGKTNKETAGHLQISVKTVETHRKNVMSKLGLHSLSDLVRYAIQNEIIRA